MSRWRYFTLDEFKCKCGCGTNEIKDDFVDKLDTLRYFYGKPIRINSGYRCPKYNASISSTGLTGPHTTGRAADINMDGEDAVKMLYLVFRFGLFNGYGFNLKGNSGRFLHLDDLTDEPRPNAWSY